MRLRGAVLEKVTRKASQRSEIYTEPGGDKELNQYQGLEK